MSQLRIDKMKKRVQNHLDKERFEHTLGVMYTAGALAMCHQVEVDRALAAGLLHDCAKCLSAEKKLKLCEKYNLTVNESEHKNPGLLHAKLGAYIAETKYDIEDEEIIDAIKYHTTGRPDMTLLGKIVYIADYIEPNRAEAPNLEEIRHLAFADIDACLYKILEDSLEYLKTKHEVIDPMTEETYFYYKKVLNK